MFVFEGDSIGGYAERVLTPFAEKLLFTISLAVFNARVIFADRARRNRGFVGVSRVLDAQLHQDKGFYLAKLGICHSNHHLDKFIKQHHIV